jgi:hypothetical protein
MKLNSNGNISWVRTYGPHLSLLNAAGTSSGGMIFVGAKNGFANRPARLFIKINRGGDILWQKVNSSGPANILLTAISTTSDDGFVVGGGVHTSWGPVNWIEKFDSKGNPSWRRTFEAPEVRAVRQEADGHILVMGVLGYGPRIQIWSGRFDSAGTLMSQYTYGERSVGDDVAAIHGTPDDGTVFVGSRYTNEGTYSFIGRSSSTGIVCEAFQESHTVSIYKPGVSSLASAHVQVRKVSFEAHSANLGQAKVGTKMANLCKKL